MPDERPVQTEFRRSAALESQLQQIGNRFLERLLPEFPAMAAKLVACQAGNEQDLADVEMFAHRIQGSGAVFGFTALSEQARILEEQLQAMKAAGSPSAALPAITERIALLQDEARAVLAKRTRRA